MKQIQKEISTMAAIFNADQISYVIVPTISNQ